MDEKPTEDYSDIGGLDKQIQELVEAVVLPVTHKERFQNLGIKPPKGVLLYGPPGTGVMPSYQFKTINSKVSCAYKAWVTSTPKKQMSSVVVALPACIIVHTGHCYLFLCTARVYISGITCHATMTTTCTAYTYAWCSNCQLITLCWTDYGPQTTLRSMTFRLQLGCNP